MKSARRGPAPVHRVEVALKPGHIDPAGHEALSELRAAGAAAADVRVVRTYFLEGPLARNDLERAAREVLADPVMDQFRVDDAVRVALKGARAVTVTRKAGVTDPEAESAAATLRALGLRVSRVKTARTYWVAGLPRARRGAPDPLLAAAGPALGNEVIEEVLPGRLLACRPLIM